MKTTAKIGLFVSVVFNLILLGILWKQTPSAKSIPNTSKAFPFSITNIAPSAESPCYVVTFQNGKSWWTVDGNILSMNVGVDQEVTLRTDSQTGRVKSTTIGLLDSTGKRCYLTDFNADGIPDKKRIGGSEDDWQIFYNGKFIPSFAKGDARHATIDGVEKSVKFDDQKWVVE